MFKSRYCLRNISAFALGLTLLLGVQSANAQEEETIILDTVLVVGTAEEQSKQALGTSIITAEDIEKRPPANDLSDIIRRQPGVNLTGSSASGARGNNRQIDLRGMGPDNTLILIDGRPAKAREGVRYGWSEERDTRGDSNWVPAEMVERIEVLRGPAAARYGSGAMGGVVNIITKKTVDKLTGSITGYVNEPEDNREGGNARANFIFSGPVTDSVSFRVYGSKARTEGDSPDLNRLENTAGNGTAGREGVNNEDLNGLLIWALNKQNTFEFGAGYSRQGNLYAGDAMHGTLTEEVNENGTMIDLIGTETNRTYRRNFFVTHSGNYNWGQTKLDVSRDINERIRLREGLAGGSEGAISGNASGDLIWDKSELKNTRVKGEVNIPTVLAGVHQTLTVGVEYLDEQFEDGGTMGRTTTTVPIPGFDPNKTDLEQYSTAVYIEDNLYFGKGFTLTPGVRVDYHEVYGTNVSPGLNATWQINENWTVKGGIARAYKAPNLYQGNPNYRMNSSGNGCYYYNGRFGGSSTANSCQIFGNEDLDPETSINKEIGVSFDSSIFNATATYFRNDYKNRVTIGTEDYTPTSSTQTYRWENSGKATVEGVEGSIHFALPKNVDFRTNVTYMIDNNEKDHDQPITVIPEYTINSFIDWEATKALTLGANMTYFGKQVPRDYNAKRGARATEVISISPYALFGIYGTYKAFDQVTFKAGVTNIFNKRLFRDGNSGSPTFDATTGEVTEYISTARTYNEPGRAFYGSVTFDF